MKRNITLLFLASIVTISLPSSCMSLGYYATTFNRAFTCHPNNNFHRSQDRAQAAYFTPIATTLSSSSRATLLSSSTPPRRTNNRLDDTKLLMKLPRKFYDGFDPRKPRRSRFIRDVKHRLEKILPEDFPPRPLWTVQRGLVYLNILCFVWQMISAILYVPTLNKHLRRAGYASFSTMDIASRNFFGGSAIAIGGSSKASSYGPFTMDFIHRTYWSRFQPHRFLTAGFLHGGIIHLGLNMRYLWSLPFWLERGLGPSLYIATYLTSIVCGNIVHSSSSSPILGASGGIFGLDGLRFVMLRRMGKKRQANAVFRNLVYLLLYGFINPQVSNASHVGGFIAGAVMGYFFGPRFYKSYAAKKFWFSSSQREGLRNVLGADKAEEPSRVPMAAFWIGLLIWCTTDPLLKTIPKLIALGVLHPGSLSGMQ